MKSPIATLVAFTITLFIGTTTHKPSLAVNYQHIICDNEPDPDRCKTIQQWYAQAKMPKSTTYGNYPASCCGIADAYWADQIDKVTDKGVYVTITDNRDCKGPSLYEDEDGNYIPQTQKEGDTCIHNRKPRNGDQIFIPNLRLDDRFQGNPTGHNVVFLGSGSAMYDGAPEKALWPTVYCAFLNFNG